MKKLKNMDTPTKRKIHELRDLGFNSLQISNRLGLELSDVNRVYGSPVSDPKNKKFWELYS